MSASIIFFALMLVSGAVCSNSQSGFLSGSAGVLSAMFFIAWICAAIAGYEMTPSELASRQVYLAKQAERRAKR